MSSGQKSSKNKHVAAVACFIGQEPSHVFSGRRKESFVVVVFSAVRHVTGPAAPSAAAQPPAGLREAEFLPLVARLPWTPRPTPLLLLELLLLLLLLRLLHLLPDDAPLKEKKSCPWLF